MPAIPRATVRETYSLEYGEDTLEMHEDALIEGERALIVDDLLATGGTAEAAVGSNRNVRRRIGIGGRVGSAEPSGHTDKTGEAGKG